MVAVSERIAGDEVRHRLDEALGMRDALCVAVVALQGLGHDVAQDGEMETGHLRVRSPFALARARSRRTPLNLLRFIVGNEMR